MPKFNGSVLVDASSIACEMKPKRKPKKPKKKRVEEKRPATLLELAMSKERPSGSPTAAKSHQQRDLMLLKQNELSMTFWESPRNGGGHNQEKQDSISTAEPTKKTKHARDISGNEVKTESRVNGYSNKQINEESNNFKNAPKLPNSSVNHSQNSGRTEPPEIETWAHSGSDADDDNWDDFDNFSSGEIRKGENDITMTTSKMTPTSEVEVQMSDSIKGQPTKTGYVVSPTNGVQVLGNEFEIAVKVKPPTPNKELDFFADMVPEIKAQKVISVPAQQEISPRKRGSFTSTTGSTKSSPVSVSFNAIEDDPVSDGWGEDTVEWDD